MYRRFFSGPVLAGRAAPIVKVTVLFLASALVAIPSGPVSADTYLQKLGGPGGQMFIARCQPNEYLVGFDLQTGETIDAIRPSCVAAFGPTNVGPIHGFGRFFGGEEGGDRPRIVCPKNMPVVTGLDVGWSGEKAITVHSIKLVCGVATGEKTMRGDGPEFYGYTRGIFSNLGGKRQNCADGLVAVGITGRYGVWLDAVGLICSAAIANTGPAKALGRAGPTTTGPNTVEGICKSAQVARARNSPAAPGLEAQCNALVAQHNADLGQPVEAVPDDGQSADTHVLANKAGAQIADLTIVSITGPKNLQAGLSGTYKISIANVGKASATVELTILFAKALDQTGQVVPNANGLACGNVGTGGPINAQLNCSGGRLGAGETGTVVVQGRGQASGAGMLVGTLNNSRSLQEVKYDNNVAQINVTIN